jgi:predicted TIM-barrel fold metal-dependent hydrolase
MFGSDWPVCNVGGPAGEEGSWKLWREVVEKWMDGKGSGEEEKTRVWRGAGEEAYGVVL